MEGKRLPIDPSIESRYDECEYDLFRSSNGRWFYHSDEDFGAWKANQLTEELSALTANYPIKVRHGKKMVEVTAAENNKGAAVARVLEQNDNYEVALCAGDDLTDESMFELS